MNPLHTPSSRNIRIATGLLAALLLAACQEQETPKPVQRVLVQNIEEADFSAEVRLTGDIQARVEAQQAFRVGGKIIERLVDVGDQVQAQQVLARLDPQEQRSNLDTANAAVTAQRAQLREAELAFERQRKLLPKGYTSRSEFDQAQAQLRATRSSLDAAEAQAANARDMLAYTELKASTDGVITSRHAEVGQVVQATVPIFTLAREGERDAVFNVYESLFDQQLESQDVTVALLGQPQVTAKGEVREITPTIDPQSGTLKVKVALQDVPPQMNLGAVVTTRLRPRSGDGVVLPWSALTKAGREPAVWLVGDDQRVALQKVGAVRYATGKVLVGQGLQAGQRVVIAGGQLLHPGQQVEIARAEQAAEPDKAAAVREDRGEPAPQPQVEGSVPHE